MSSRGGRTLRTVSWSIKKIPKLATWKVPLIGTKRIPGVTSPCWPKDKRVISPISRYLKTCSYSCGAWRRREASRNNWDGVSKANLFWIKNNKELWSNFCCWVCGQRFHTSTFQREFSPHIQITGLFQPLLGLVLRWTGPPLFMPLFIYDGVISLGHVIIPYSLCFLHLAKSSEHFPMAKYIPIRENFLTHLWWWAINMPR